MNLYRLRADHSLCPLTALALQGRLFPALVYDIPEHHETQIQTQCQQLQWALPEILLSVVGLVNVSNTHDSLWRVRNAIQLKLSYQKHAHADQRMIWGLIIAIKQHEDLEMRPITEIILFQNHCQLSPPPPESLTPISQQSPLKNA